MDPEIYGKPVTNEQMQKIADGGKRKIRVRKSGGEFIKGPIPVEWMRTAIKLGMACATTGIALWFKWGVERQQPFPATHSLFTKFGIKPRTARHAMQQLELKKLISVERHHGRSPVVTIEPLDGD